MASSPQSWGASPDPHKPELPYRSGLCFSIQRHTPPPPFDVGGYDNATVREECPSESIQGFSQSEWCLQHPPMDTPLPTDPTTHNLRIIDQVVCKDGRGAQIVKCCLDKDEKRVYAAKIYDALYYKFIHDEFEAYYDVTRDADGDYACEAAAYEDLQASGVDGVWSPAYHGSWTFSMALKNSPEVRHVRMILMEYIEGVSMSSLIEKLQTSRVALQRRLDILAQTFEAKSMLSFYGVQHLDLAPRNIMLQGSDIAAEISRVVVIDFNRSRVLRRAGPEWRRILEKNILPLNPISHATWRSCPPAFRCWVPQPHRTRPRYWKGWMKNLWAESKEFRPLDRDYGKKTGSVDLDDFAEMVAPQPDPPEGTELEVELIYDDEEKQRFEEWRRRRNAEFDAYHKAQAEAAKADQEKPKKKAGKGKAKSTQKQGKAGRTKKGL